MPTEPPPSRPIVRGGGRAVPFIVWELSRQPSNVIERCLERGADWFVIPHSISNDDLRRWMQRLNGAHGILGIDSAALSLRSTQTIDDRLHAAGPAKLDAILLQNISLGQIKEGRIFHRVAQLRERGRVELCVVEADSLAEAEWMLRHTPAQGVALRYGIGDQSARYRILPEAAELDTAIFARRPPAPVWPIENVEIHRDLSFLAANAHITAVIEPLPETKEQVDASVDAVRTPMSAGEVERLWQEFCQHVCEPPKPRGAHPPEWA